MATPKARTHSVRLSDGSSVLVDDKTAWGINRILTLVDHLAAGRTQAVVLVEAQHGTRPQTLVFTYDGERLAEVGDALGELSGRVHRLGSVWEGNAPALNRSGMLN
jgi:hypothetical protein